VPLEKLQQIKGLGQHYSKLIKDAVNDLYEPKEKAPSEPVLDVTPRKKKKPEKADSNLRTEIAKTTKYLKRAKNKFEPINKKKHLKLLVDFKTASSDLKTQIQVLRRTKLDLSKKQKKKITKKVAALNKMLKNAGKTKKGKTMKALSQEIRSLLKLISN
jgi:hypothetical protein